MRTCRALQELRRYDVLFTPSQAARQDCLNLLDLPADRVVTIEIGVDGSPIASGRDTGWTNSATRLLETLSALRTPRMAQRPRPKKQPRIAFFSPLPPMRSGISDYSASLLNELKQSYAIDLYHADDYLPDLAFRDDFDCLSARLFEHYRTTRDYHAIVYQMGNSHYHTYLHPIMLRHPGVVTLHDFCLVGFHLQQGSTDHSGKDAIRRALIHWYPEHREAIVARFRDLPWDWDAIQRECARSGWYLNRELFACSGRVVVHSPWCEARARESCPESADRASVIKLGASPRTIAPESRPEIRARFGIAQDALVVASFGLAHADKMICESLIAFESVARTNPAAIYLVVGEESDRGEARLLASSEGLAGRVRFLGRRSAADFADLVAIADIGVNLRRPPTYGETSAALLNLLASGVPAIVTDVATFSDYPDHVVRKVRWDADGPERLRRALLDLAACAESRRRLGQAAWNYVRDHHAWPQVAKRYVEVIEAHHDQLAANRPDPWARLAV
jgi:glycosyltransferase involved in cell wall biosynthesis